MQKFVNIPVHPETRDALREVLAAMRTNRPRHTVVSYDLLIENALIALAEKHRAQKNHNEVYGAIGAEAGHE